MEQKIRSLGEPNNLYVFTDEFNKVQGIFIDFHCINRLMIMDKDFDQIYDYAIKDGNRVMRIHNGLDIYELIPDKVESICVKSCEKQIREFIVDLTKHK